MQTGKKINQISNRLRRRSRAIQETIGISGAQGNILNYILVESQNRSVYQKDIEQEFGLRPSTATKALKSLKKNELMGSMKVSNVIAKMAIPSVISSLVTVVYNMADTFFVGQTGDPLQVAAVSLTNPIFILLMAFANMFGMGGSAVASMAMGEKNEKRVKNTSAFVTYASLIVGILFALILIFSAMAGLTIMNRRKAN